MGFCGIKKQQYAFKLKADIAVDEKFGKTRKRFAEAFI